jgi:hypothetical protein
MIDNAIPVTRFAVFWACSDGLRGPVTGTATFDSEEAAAREASRMHAAKPFINYRASVVVRRATTETGA